MDETGTRKTNNVSTAPSKKRRSRRGGRGKGGKNPDKSDTVVPLTSPSTEPCLANEKVTETMETTEPINHTTNNTMMNYSSCMELPYSPYSYNGAGAIGTNYLSYSSPFAYYSNGYTSNATSTSTDSSSSTLNYVMTPIGPCALVSLPYSSSTPFPTTPSPYSYVPTVSNSNANPTTNSSSSSYLMTSSDDTLPAETSSANSTNYYYPPSVPSAPYSPSLPPPYYTSSYPPNFYGASSYSGPNFSPIDMINQLPFAFQDSIVTGKYKSKLCIFWLNSGGQSCPYNALCMYAHGTHELYRNVVPATIEPSKDTDIPNTTIEPSKNDGNDTGHESSVIVPSNIPKDSVTPPLIPPEPLPTYNGGRCHEYLLTGTCTRKHCTFIHHSHRVLVTAPKPTYATYRTDKVLHDNRQKYGHGRSVSLPIFGSMPVGDQTNVTNDNAEDSSNPAIGSNDSNVAVSGSIQTNKSKIRSIRSHYRSRTMMLQKISISINDSTKDNGTSSSTHNSITVN